MSDKSFKLVTSNKDRQKTIKDKVIFSGVSPYVSGKMKTELIPGEIDSGIVFDSEGIKIPSLIANAKKDDETHTTTLTSEGIEIKTVEHLLASVWGMGIDNLLIKMYSKHLPFFDSSAEFYTKKINGVGIKEQQKKRKYVKVIKEEEFFEKPDEERKAVFKPLGGLKINSRTAFEEPVGDNTVEIRWSPEEFMENISWARSFLRSPVDEKGEVWASIEKIFPNISDKPEDSGLIVYDKNGFLTPLRVEDEPARHKLLDFFGDISLLGHRILADIYLNLPGHRFTRQIAADIRSHIDS